MITTIAQLSKKLHQLFTTTAERIGEKSGYNLRPAQKWSPEILFTTLVSIFLAKPEASLLTMCGVASLGGVVASRQGLDKRFNPRSVDFMQAMLAETVKVSVGVLKASEQEILNRFYQVIISDSTIINLPTELAEQFKGTSREPDYAGFAALKAHVGLDLLSGKLWGPFIGAGKVHDNAGAIDFNTLGAGSLVIRDLGFWDLASWKQRHSRGIYTLSRLKAGTAVFNQAGKRFDLLAQLQAQGRERVELSVTIGQDERIPVRVLATKVPDDVKLGRLNAHKIEEEDPGAAWHGWTILVTDVPEQRLTLLEAYVLYRLRWQIELLFKRWKEIGLVDEWQTKNPSRILCEIYAKLIAALISHWITVLSVWEAPERSMVCALHLIQLQGLSIFLFLRDEKVLRSVLERLADALFATARQGTRRSKPSSAQLLANPELALPLRSPPLQKESVSPSHCDSTLSFVG